jgi:hypothetical protein
MLPSNRSRSPYEDGTKPVTVHSCQALRSTSTTSNSSGRPHLPSRLAATAPPLPPTISYETVRQALKQTGSSRG